MAGSRLAELSLAPLFEPRSVAVYGASRDPRKLGHTLLRNVLSGGFEGHVVAVNPAAEPILGVESVPVLTEPVDLALVSVPADSAEAPVAQAASVGCRAVVVLASGFAETGPEGRALQDRLAAVAREAGMRLVGPNCMGVVSRLGGAWLNASYFWQVPDVPGTVSFVSQSGAMGGMFLAQVARGRFGLARFASLGNSADVTETDVLAYLAGDDLTGVIGIFSEAIRDGRRFVEAALGATTRKPVVVLKAGRRQAGAAAAVGHTGSLAGAHGAARAAFARAGVIEAEDSGGFFDALTALAAYPRARAGPRVAIVTISGGPAVLASDTAEARGLTLPAPEASTTERLRALVPGFAALANPVDLTPQCALENFRPAIGCVFDDPGFDGVVAIDCGLDVEEFGQGVAEAATRTGKPVTAFLLDVPRVADVVARAGIPVFDSPEGAVAGYAALVRA